jgi:hypothetical protein
MMREQAAADRDYHGLIREVLEVDILTEKDAAVDWSNLHEPPTQLSASTNEVLGFILAELLSGLLDQQRRKVHRFDVRAAVISIAFCDGFQALECLRCLGFRLIGGEPVPACSPDLPETEGCGPRVPGRTNGAQKSETSPQGRRSEKCKLGDPFSGTIEDQQRLLDEYGFGDHGARAAGTGPAGDCRQRVQKQDNRSRTAQS